MNHKNTLFTLLILFLCHSWVVAEELESALLYGKLLTEAVKGKNKVRLKKLPEYKKIKQYLSQNKCSKYKYKAYIVGPKDKQFLYLIGKRGKSVILGRHFKVPIINGAIDITHFEKSTKGCLNFGKPKPDVAALSATHLKAYPNEFHILQSQLSGLTFYIITNTGTYSVKKGKIKKLEEKD